MARRPITSSPFLAALLAAGLGLTAPACASRTPETSAGAAPAATSPADSAAPAPSTASDTGGTAAPESAAPESAAAPAATPAPAAADSFLTYDAATNTVTFELIAGPFDFNGYTSGGATLTVPPGSSNVINFEQKDGTPHSAEISSGTGPVPNSGGDAAIPRAYTNKLVEGLPQGATDVLKFTAPDSGSYRIICGVPGHALSGMWIWYKVDPAAKRPSFGPTSK
jgi:plastocyanin